MVPTETGVNIEVLKTMYNNKLRDKKASGNITESEIIIVDEFIAYLYVKPLDIVKLVALKNQADSVL